MHRNSIYFFFSASLIIERNRCMDAVQLTQSKLKLEWCIYAAEVREGYLLPLISVVISRSFQAGIDSLMERSRIHHHEHLESLGRGD